MHVRRPVARAIATATVVLGTLMAAGCADDEVAGEEPAAEETTGGGPVRISGQNFPSATLIASMYEEVLENAGYEPEVKLVDTRDIYMQTFPGGVDVVPEYAGSLATFLNTTTNGADAPPVATSDAAETLDNVASLLEEKGITTLAPSEAADSNAFFVTEEYAEAEGVATLSDMEGKSVVLAAHPDCEGRPDCEGGLSKVYGIDVTKILPLGFASDATYQSVLDDESQLGLTSTADGTLEAQGLVLLDDDQGIAAAENLVPAVSTEFLDAHPDVEEVLDGLMAALTTEKLIELNSRISVDREQPEDVAEDFLESEGLL